MDEQNYFQRDTSLLQDSEVRQEVLGLHRIARAVAAGEYQMALGLVEGFIATKSENLEVQRQVKLLATMSYFKTGNIIKGQQWLSGLLREVIPSSKTMPNFQARVLAYAASLFIEQIRPQIDPKVCISELTDLVKYCQQSNRNSTVLPMVLGMLTGCRNFKPVSELTELKGDLSRKKAIKCELIASWKFLLGQNQDSITFKKESLSIWEQLNRLQESKTCKSELRQLCGQQQGSYIQKLKRINYFTRELIQLECPSLQNYQPILKLSIKGEVFDLSRSSQQPQTPLKSSKMTASRLQRDKKNQFLNQVLIQDQKFVKQYSQEVNGEITRFIQNSKFVRQRVKMFTKRVGKIVRKGTRHYRDFFDRITAQPSEEELELQDSKEEKGILKNVDGKEVGKKVAKSIVKKVLFK